LLHWRVEVDDLVLNADLVDEGLELEDVVGTGGLKAGRKVRIASLEKQKKGGRTSPLLTAFFLAAAVSPAVSTSFVNSPHHLSITLLNRPTNFRSTFLSSSATHASRFAYPSRFNLSIVFCRLANDAENASPV
jgi:hypothetical protein